jgi:hypothetical protein
MGPPHIKDHVSQFYNTTAKIIFVYILIFRFVKCRYNENKFRTE